MRIYVAGSNIMYNNSQRFGPADHMNSISKMLTPNKKMGTTIYKPKKITNQLNLKQ